MNNKNPKVEFFFTKAGKWQKACEKLRGIVLQSGLVEEVKWGVPCYTLENRNVLLMHVFNDYCALLFFKGALLRDGDGILVQQTKNVQAARQIRFINVREIIEMEPILKAYVQEAIEVERSGAKVKLKKTDEFDMPDEFQKRLDKNRALRTAFAALTPGRQRGYLLYFSTAKQSKTRESRIDKYIPKILKGNGLDD